MSYNDSKEFVLPGLKPVLEILQEAPDRIINLYCRNNLSALNGKLKLLCDQNSVIPKYVDNNFLDNLCKSRQGYTINHQGIAAIIKKQSLFTPLELFELAHSAPLPLILALDQIKDPGNLGALCRTAYALGCAGILLPRHNSASPGAGSLKSSAGALDKLPCAIVANLARALDEAEENGFTLYAAACGQENKAVSAFNHVWQTPAILTLGSEQKGIRPGVLKRCSIHINIPFARKFDSLNIAQAGAILIGLAAANIGKPTNQQ